jgi:DNA-binding TFAR19-related protein (PDSD5 family)
MMDEEQLQAELELAKNIKLIENLAKSKMSKDAISRYGNIKIAHPEKAVKVISYIAEAVNSGQINEIITDKQFKELLVRI